MDSPLHPDVAASTASDRLAKAVPHEVPFPELPISARTCQVAAMTAAAGASNRAGTTITAMNTPASLKITPPVRLIAGFLPDNPLNRSF